MTDLIAELAEVVRLSDRATPGEWFAWNDDFYAKVDAAPDGPNIANTGRSSWPESTGNAEYIAALHNLLRTHHAEIEAMARDARGEREESWEVWQDDMPVAGSEDLPDALHYLAMYQQDGLVTLKRAVVYRETITPEQLAAMHDSAREGGDE
jgi:hypothetical protein